MDKLTFDHLIKGICLVIVFARAGRITAFVIEAGYDTGRYFEWQSYAKLISKNTNRSRSWNFVGWEPDGSNAGR